MAAAEESHGAVDGVEGPDPTVGPAGAVAGVDGLEHCFFGLDGAAEFVFRGGIFQAGGFHQFPDLVGEGFVFSKGGGFFFADDFVRGEVVLDGMDYEGLGAEVADCDGGFVVFGDGAFGFFTENALGEEGGALDG